MWISHGGNGGIALRKARKTAGMIVDGWTQDSVEFSILS
jgi:hypothetical protein